MQKETCGIYVITERANQRPRYVGQSIGIEGRWPKHWKKFPKERFDYRVIQECPPAELNFWEKYYIRALKTHWTEAGENQNWGGQHWRRPEEPLSPATRAKLSATLKGRAPHNKGMPLSEKHKSKISAALKGRVGRVQSEETKAKLSAVMKDKNNKGKPLSEETRAKLKGRVSANKGKLMSEEQKSKISAALKGSVRSPMSEEAKAKISAVLKGRVMPEEQKAKLKSRVQSEEEKAKRRGRVMPEEEKAKRSATMKGIPKSEETRAKMSEARKALWALKRAAKAAADAALEALLTLEIISNPE